MSSIAVAVCNLPTQTIPEDLAQEKVISEAVTVPEGLAAIMATGASKMIPALCWVRPLCCRIQDSSHARSHRFKIPDMLIAFLSAKRLKMSGVAMPRKVFRGQSGHTDMFLIGDDIHTRNVTAHCCSIEHGRKEYQTILCCISQYLCISKFTGFQETVLHVFTILSFSSG